MRGDEAGWPGLGVSDEAGRQVRLFLCVKMKLGIQARGFFVWTCCWKARLEAFGMHRAYHLHQGCECHAASTAKRLGEAPGCAI
eukprot:352864-Chlamydomonas_euryale.AAC.4